MGGSVSEHFGFCQKNVSLVTSYLDKDGYFGEL